jgi:protein-disulfide isomerase
MADSPSLYERILAGILTAATLVVVALLIEGRLNNESRDPSPRAEHLAQWETQMADALVPLGDTARPVKVVVFTDFQCPFCANLDSTLRRIENQHSGRIARLIVHFPLPGHEFAVDAAMAFECANGQHFGREMHDLLYEEQPRFGGSSWELLASKVGIKDTMLFGACLRDRRHLSRINAGEALGRDLAIRGTPVVVVNGWLFDPSFPESVDRAINAVLDGRSPKNANRRVRSQ